MRLDFIPQDKLVPSRTNMRYAKKAPDVTDILPTVRKRGVIQPLIVRPNCAPDGFEIVAGFRRWTANGVALGEGIDHGPLPCAILDPGDDADAIEASMIENMARLDPDEVTQWESFVRLVKEGRKPDEIAATFGLPDLTVKRILALGNLLPRIRDLYRAGEDRCGHRTAPDDGDQEPAEGVAGAVRGRASLCPDRPPVEGVAVRRRGDLDQGRAVRRGGVRAARSSATCSPRTASSPMPMRSGPRRMPRSRPSAPRFSTRDGAMRSSSRRPRRSSIGSMSARPSARAGASISTCRRAARSRSTKAM